MTLAYFLLWFVDTLLLMAFAPRMEGWSLVNVITLYGAATWEGMLYFNGVIAEKAMRKG